MFYIFNANNVCVCYCQSKPDIEDLATRNEYYVENENSYIIGSYFKNETIVEPINTIDYKTLARNLRNSIRNKIDKFLLPAATINDVLVTEDQKQILIQDSLLLAAWPVTDGWPYVNLPSLSDLCQSLITIPLWDYPNLMSTTEE